MESAILLLSLFLPSQIDQQCQDGSIQQKMWFHIEAQARSELPHIHLAWQMPQLMWAGNAKDGTEKWRDPFEELSYGGRSLSKDSDALVPLENIGLTTTSEWDHKGFEALGRSAETEVKSGDDPEPTNAVGQIYRALTALNGLPNDEGIDQIKATAVGIAKIAAASPGELPPDLLRWASIMHNRAERFSERKSELKRALRPMLSQRQQFSLDEHDAQERERVGAQNQRVIRRYGGFAERQAAHLRFVTEIYDRMEQDEAAAQIYQDYRNANSCKLEDFNGEVIEYGWGRLDSVDEIPEVLNRKQYDYWSAYFADKATIRDALKNWCKVELERQGVPFSDDRIAQLIERNYEPIVTALRANLEWQADVARDGRFREWQSHRFLQADSTDADEDAEFIEESIDSFVEDTNIDAVITSSSDDDSQSDKQESDEETDESSENSVESGPTDGNLPSGSAPSTESRDCMDPNRQVESRKCESERESSNALRDVFHEVAESCVLSTAAFVLAPNPAAKTVFGLGAGASCSQAYGRYLGHREAESKLLKCLSRETR